MGIKFRDIFRAAPQIALSAIPGVGQFMANQENIQQSQSQMNFQERMSNTAHQREVADLKAAGLNPMLSAGTGGSSTPQGAMANMQSSAGEAGNAFLLALAAKKQQEEISLMKAQKNKTNTEAHVLRKGIPESDAKNMIWDWMMKTFRGTSAKSSGGILSDPSVRFKKGETYKSLYGDKWHQQPLKVGKP